MKIYTGKSIAQYESNNYRTKTDSIKKTGEISVQQDRITIGSNPETLKEKTIIGKAAATVTAEIRTAKSEDRLELLRQQISEGTYRPDADRIAAKILLLD
ncbi:MAG: flagellar biosynthesis anti-sigma factor FlgM [Firmicutes bacterium]|nr:flagellar biosynthesis anti-sigma factor FlgM [Bacillota bacterium]